MNKEFIPYEQALALKELGFDKEICFGRWTTYPDGEGFLDTTKHSIYQGRDDLNRQCLAPLYQQAFTWFREKYGLCTQDFIDLDNKFTKNIVQINKNSQDFFYLDYYKTYEEAEFECLKKLIEIVKEK